jgi:hypothetical protein
LDLSGTGSFHLEGGNRQTVQGGLTHTAVGDDRPATFVDKTDLPQGSLVDRAGGPHPAGASLFRTRLPYCAARAPLLMESEAALYVLMLDAFSSRERYPSSDQARGHASLENALFSSARIAVRSEEYSRYPRHIPEWCGRTRTKPCALR